MNRFFTVTLEVDVTFRVTLDHRDDVCERSVYRTWTEIEPGPDMNQKINANRTWIEITTPTTSYCLWLVGESKCRQSKQATLHFTNIHHKLFPSSPSAHNETNLLPSLQPQHQKQLHPIVRTLARTIETQIPKLLARIFTDPPIKMRAKCPHNHGNLDPATFVINDSGTTVYICTASDLHV
jgi:hypothetical protein